MQIIAAVVGILFIKIWCDITIAYAIACRIAFGNSMPKIFLYGINKSCKLQMVWLVVNHLDRPTHAMEAHQFKADSTTVTVQQINAYHQINDIALDAI